MELASETEVSTVEYYQKNLKKVFDHYLRPFVGDPNSNLKIMSVGCGYGFEADPLLKIFPNATYMGIDVDADVIGVIKELSPDLNERCLFKIADAREEDAFDKGPWDIIVLRHPQVLGSTIDPNVKKDWARIMKNCVSAVNKRGVLFVSTDSEMEREQILEYINNQPRDKMEIVTNEHNIHPSSKGGHKDSFVVVGKKI